MTTAKFIPGGACAAQGFTASGVHCGIRKNRSKPDLALILSQAPAAAAAVYTRNLVKGAPLLVTKEHLADGYARAVLCNSGNANTCNADGVAIAEAMCALVEQHTGVPAGDVVIASTGVIGVPLPLAPIAAGMPALAGGLSSDGFGAATAIMTTDTFAKEVAAECTLGGKTVRLGGMAKGSGMIHPNMATMLVFLTTDAAIAPAVLQTLLQEEADETFNMLSVDGDTSTNDMVSILANGLAGNAEITQASGKDGEVFRAALHSVMAQLCRMLAKDGEGATKLLECSVTGAKDQTAARLAARSVISSSLFKAAMFGADANWGRVLCAIGYSGADVEIGQIAVTFRSAAGALCVCQNGAGVPFSEDLAKQVLAEDEIQIDISAGAGAGSATAWGCDLTYDYVKINGDYRT
ncbi:MAG: bifunctional glutamate N-acetyltransferase/amino-acid acetyltransferase ArgJ [Oscillospiraceae bacterium]|jgi:glutamate N-acetyltransferase/amino-acid N-acetyltransferase|nr:bifunctional glutamate N-acetyltransferase/amino-acid acetyltransferase ArgJ [Oscillospiraceae bacterium]